MPNYAARSPPRPAETPPASPDFGITATSAQLSLFRYPDKDNNPAERAIRRPVVTRKNAYGSRNDDAARLAARIWTVTATAEMAGLNVLTYLMAYLDACGRNGGKPLPAPELERFLPWNAAPADKEAWSQPPRPG
jgi:transposase